MWRRLARRRSPEEGARLVLEDDGHVAAGVQVAARDVDHGSPGDGPAAGLQVDEPGHLWTEGRRSRRWSKVTTPKGHGCVAVQSMLL